VNDIKGTDFQKMVWSEIKKIPKGKTITYKELALKIGKPRAYRAVANACAKNPLLETIPCHRVVRCDGKMGGYKGKKGIERKKKLLESEGVNLKSLNRSFKRILRSL
jgi:AraC family transcriptional regulator of adaptative response/methylated-DNA-[protein]-cysteine methyltransferase